MTDMEKIFAIATANRLLAADMFDGLTPPQWTTPSLCQGWTVREIAAHLVPKEGVLSLLFFVGALIRHRGDVDRTIDEMVRGDAQRPVEEIVHLLRERATNRLRVPGVGALGPMTDTAIHLRDAARPLGVDANPDPPSWKPVLDFLVSMPATRTGFIPRNRLPGLHLCVVDGTWSWGAGAEVRGTSEAVAMAVAGRTVVLPELSGAGTTLLAQRLSPPPA